MNLKNDLIFFIWTDVRINHDYRIDYLMEQYDEMPPAVIPSVQAIEKWPEMILNYLERCIQFENATNREQNVVTEFDDVLGQPINIACEYVFFKTFFLPLKMKTFRMCQMRGNSKCKYA